MTVKRMLSEMDSDEFTEWAAFFGLEPWGADVEDHRFGTLAATVFNYGGMSIPKRRLGPGDFFPRIKPPAKRKTPAELRAAGLRAFGGNAT